MGASSDRGWKAFSDHVDRILELSEPDLARYLADLEKTDPATANRLGVLLRARARAGYSSFLSDSALPGLEQPASSLVGRTVGPYVIDAEIGRGGMGSVWRAHRADGRFEGTVAIKFLHALWQSRTGEQRFRIEGKLLGQLDHPNIARLIDAGVLEGSQPYLVIEYIEGEPIDLYCKEHGLGLRARVELFLAVLAAVAHAHGHLIVHRDIKPANIFVTRDGSVKLLDFGIAKLLGSEAEAAALTRSGAVALTPQYAAPEQLLAQPVTTGTDVYALGLVLYVLLTGRHPVASESLSSAELIRTVLTEDAAPASQVAGIPGIGPRALAGDLDNILAKALKKSSAERYASAEALAEDLRRYLDFQPVLARADSLGYRLGKFLRRHRGGVAASAVVASILVAAVIAIYLQKIEADRERQEATLQALRVQESYRFLSSMVEEIGAEGGTMSPTQILDRGMYLLEHQDSVDPRAKVDEMRQMGTFYASLFESRKEQEVLSRAEELARRYHYIEGLIELQCDQVDTELDLDHRDKAQARLGEAQRLLSAMAHPTALLRGMVEEQAAVMAAANGHNDVAIGYAQGALRILRTGGEENTANYAAILSRLSVYHDALGHPQEAHRYTELTGAAWDRLHGTGSLESLTILNNESVDLINFGEVRAALATSAEVLRRLQARGAGAAVQVPFRTNYGARLAAMGRYPEALSFLDRAIADASTSKNLYWQRRAQYFRACALVHAGKQAEAQPALDAIDKAYRTDAVKNEAALESLAVCRSEWLLGGGEAQLAQESIERLLREVGYPQHTSLPVLRTALPAAARIALARNDLRGAEGYAAAAADYASKAARDPKRSADRGRALVLLAQAQHAGKDDAAAVQVLKEALPSLAGGLGSDHTEVVTAKGLLADWTQGPKGTT
jgi:serine/threonine-protein kinase